MEINKMPVPPKEMRRVPPPPPRPGFNANSNTATVKEVNQSEQPTAVVKQAIPVKETEQNPVEKEIVESSKKLKKENKSAEDMDNIGLVDVRQTKKVDSKAMFYYVGIFVSLAIIAVLIFLILN